MSRNPREALARAVQADDTARARDLLQRHPELASRLDDPMPELPFGTTVLIAAVDRKNREMIDLLLRAGADINARSDWWAGGFGVLDGCDPTLAPYLIAHGAAVDAHAAARLDMRNALEALVDADPGLVHARGGDGQTPLHFAATVEIAQYLLDHGADIDARDVDHEATPAQYMVRDRQDVARFLVGRGCHTDILMAAALGDLALVRAHLDADPASIHMRVSDQHFPKRNPRSGGHIYIWTLGGKKTAHSVAREFGHEAIVRLLMERSPDELKLAQAYELGDEEAVTTLLANRPDLVGALPTGERRKVADAAQNNNIGAVRLMLAAGWPPDARGDHGGTPLHFAAWVGNSDMVREILRYGPPLEARDHDFDGTPLGWALHGSGNCWEKGRGDYASTVEALLEAGAKAQALAPDSEVSESIRAVLRRYGE